jgi:hypothetical protein
MSSNFNCRRQVLKRSAIALLSLASIPIVVLPQNAHAGSAAKSDFHYQNSPHDGKHCSECTAFLPSPQNQNSEGTCRIIAGPVSPLGWCMAFSPKG